MARQLTRRSGPNTTCTLCHEPVRWWRSDAIAARSSSGWLCVDFSPDDDGDVMRLPRKWTDPETGKQVPCGRLLRTAADLAGAIADGELLFTRHVRTCRGRRPAA